MTDSLQAKYHDCVPLQSLHFVTTATATSATFPSGGLLSTLGPMELPNTARLKGPMEVFGWKLNNSDKNQQTAGKKQLIRIILKTSAIKQVLRHSDQDVSHATSIWQNHAKSMSGVPAVPMQPWSPPHFQPFEAGVQPWGVMPSTWVMGSGGTHQKNPSTSVHQWTSLDGLQGLMKHHWQRYVRCAPWSSHKPFASFWLLRVVRVFKLRVICWKAVVPHNLLATSATCTRHDHSSQQALQAKLHPFRNRYARAECSSVYIGGLAESRKVPVLAITSRTCLQRLSSESARIAAMKPYGKIL